MRPFLVLPVALSALLACSDASEPELAGLPSFPLFQNLEQECANRALECREARALGDLELTVAPPEIDWAPDIYAAIERGKAEGKPIFLATSVSKGGVAKSGCDV